MVSSIGTSESPLIGFAGGGTGGHLYPAIAVTQALQRRLPHARFIFFATTRPIDQQIITEAGYELIRQPLLPISTVPWRWPGIWQKYRASSHLCHRKIIRDRPDIMVGTGGLGSLPPMRLALRSGIPTALLNPDLIPGRANHYLAKKVNLVFAQWEDSTKFLSKSTNIRVTGCPVRQAFQDQFVSDAHERFNLDPAKKTLLVTGASQGARTINQAVVAILDDLQTSDSWQILHLAGNIDFESVSQAYQGRAIRATVLPFTHQMSAAMSIATLVISRAGASTLAELASMGRPSLLCPYPFHKDMHQVANAEMMVHHGASVMMKDAKDVSRNATALRKILLPLMGDEIKLGNMAQAARDVGRPDAAEAVASEIITCALRSRMGTTHTSREPDFCME